MAEWTAPEAYNPLHTDHLGTSLANAIEATDPVPLSDIPQFTGAGVYALYYTGDFPAYRLMAEANRNGQWRHAIYIGKAVPAGSRKGTDEPELSAAPVEEDEITEPKPKKRRKKKPPMPLVSRLDNHRKSIEAANNLKLGDFYARWLVVEPIWIPLAESVMIQRSACLWNRALPGFGVNAQGKGRKDGSLSNWDILHPGRKRDGYMPTDAARRPAYLAQEAEGWLTARI